MADKIVDKFAGKSQNAQAKSQLLGSLGIGLLGSLFNDLMSRRSSRRRGSQNEQ